MVMIVVIGAILAIYIGLKIATSWAESGYDNAKLIPRETPLDPDVHWLFKTKVVGVSHRNSDRTSRQKIIREQCSVGDYLRLIPEPGNKNDPNAIGVWTNSGSQIGYLDWNVARIAAEKHEAQDLVAKIIGVHGGENKRYLGVALQIGRKQKATASHSSV